MQTSVFDMEAGEWGRVTKLLCVGEVHRRLSEMGVVADTAVLCVGKAPFAGAVEIYVRGYHLALGRQEARSILIEKGGERVATDGTNR